MLKSGMNNKELGQYGENIACEYLEKQGYKIVERNIHFSRTCELDIIAIDKNSYVFVEVKTRRTLSCGSPFEAITKTKFNNIKTGVYSYLSQHQEIKKYRIDVISIILNPETKIEHLKNVSI